jgi:hypothetical protein
MGLVCTLWACDGCASYGEGERGGLPAQWAYVPVALFREGLGVRTEIHTMCEQCVRDFIALACKENN